MIKVLFVCMGNICRSPMAEFVFKALVKEEGLSDSFYIASAATSSEEVGNPVHRGTREKLKSVGISTAGKYAAQMRADDYEKYDYIIGMEKRNLTYMQRITGGDSQGKMHRLLDFSDRPRDIADPWYTGEFDVTYEDVLEGCRALLDYIKRGGELK